MDTIITASFTEGTVLKNMMDYRIADKKGSHQHEGVCLRFLDPEMHYKVRKITTKVNDSLQILANEPSLGLYRIQEHIHRTIPALVERKRELEANKKKLEGVSYDLDYSISAVDSIGYIKQFTSISEALKCAIDAKEKLDERETKEHQMKEYEASSAKQANKSISENTIAEGYICPICYFAHDNQDALMSHWKMEHNLETCENEVFDSIEITKKEENTSDCEEVSE